MALTFRSSTASTAGGSGNALTVTKPSGVADGDILVAAMYWETDANTITPPAGWTLILKETNVNPSPTIQLVAFWKRASGEPSSWSFTPGTNGQWRFYICAAWSGATGSGDQVDVKGSAHGSGIGHTAPPSVTTTAATETVLMIMNNWNGDDTTYTSGPCATKRVGFAGLQIFEGTKATAGATGAGDYAFGSEDWCAITVAFKDVGAGGGGATFTATLSATQGQTATRVAQVRGVRSGTQAQTASRVVQASAVRVAVQGQAAAAVKAVAATRTATTGQTTTRIIQARRTLSATQAQTAISIALKVFLRTLSATQGQAASVVRSVAAVRVAGQGQAPTLARAVSHVVLAQQASQATATKAVARTLAATTTQAATVTRALGRIVAAAQSALASLATVFIPVGQKSPGAVAIGAVPATVALTASAATAVLAASVPTATIGVEP